jgi:hypothetical protein
MIALLSRSRLSRRAVAATTMLALGTSTLLSLAGCADLGDTALSAFADPAKYDYFDCKQLEAERKTISTRTAESQGLMAKAETGAAGSVVGELAYRNDYITARAQSKLVEEAWRRNKCHETPPSATTPTAAATPPAKDKPAHSRSGNSVSGSAAY